MIPLGKFLVKLGYAKEEQIDEALKRQRELGEFKFGSPRILPSIFLSLSMAKTKWKDYRIGKILIEMGAVTPEQIEEALKKQREDRSKHIGSSLSEFALIEIPSIINSALNVYDLLSNVMVLCNTIVNSKASALYLCDGKTDKLIVNFYTDHEEISQMHVSTENIAGWVIKHNEIFLVDDLSSDKRFSREVYNFLGENIKHVACVPVRIEGQSVGAIEVINKKQGKGFSEKDLFLLSAIANQIAITLENIRLIGELDQSLQDLKEAQANIIRTEKLSAIGEMASGIAHDFNNLLMGIQGNISLMQIDIDSKHPFYERLDNIEKQIVRAARLTSHLLGYVRESRYEVRPIDLNHLIGEISSTFSRTRKEIAIHKKLANNLSAIEVDPGQIEQVLLNLFINAADAMSDRGDLIIKTANVTSEDMKEKLYDPKPGKYVELSVTDTGIGMDKKTSERIFEPFFTTKEPGQGTGLGLSSSYGIIKGCGGYIDVESKKGKGATFRIYIPASEKEARKVGIASAEIIKGTGTIFLVDDEKVILEVNQELLEAMGYRVIIAGGGKEAVEVFSKNRDEIDMVLLDMIMPTMGGGEVFDIIKEINPKVKVLLSSGYSIDGRANEILSRGCDGFIQKPFGASELSIKIKEILGKE
ncbi:MAG: response regulator [Proteobacteria bacterium]|nr:response regulator [Pseudomonadota bacterium]MBU4126596.1 response regulator [Pseudomonadota bacterium]